MGIGGGRVRLTQGAAVTFAVAAVASVVWGRVTCQITLALGAFAGPVVAGMALSYWLGRSKRSNGSTYSGDGGGSAGPQMINFDGIRQIIIASGPDATAHDAPGSHVVYMRGRMTSLGPSTLPDLSDCERKGKLWRPMGLNRRSFRTLLP